jgi:diaminopimelate epimerase
MIDNRAKIFDSANTNLIKKLCDRKFGIGADGLILLQNTEQSDFEMWYANSDGKQSTMCGNGGRSIVAFAKKLEIITNETSFIAIDGLHHATIKSDNLIELKMCDIENISNINESAFEINTGSPHLVKFVSETANFNVYEEGKKVQSLPEYLGKGINVNFVEQINERTINIRTYERGVEDETLSCGTGATAAAICTVLKNNLIDGIYNIQLNTLGGLLEVKCEKKSAQQFENVWLCGPAEFVFEGTIDL